jgi:hypothetical protein
MDNRAVILYSFQDQMMRRSDAAHDNRAVILADSEGYGLLLLM